MLYLFNRHSTPTALTYVQSNVLQYNRADLEYTLNGSNVSVWNDLSGNSHHYEQSTPSAQPLYELTGGPNSTPCITGDGSADILVNTTLDLPAPATTNLTVWMILKAITWTANDTFICSPGGSFQAGLSLIQTGSTPQACLANESIGPTGNITLGSWLAVECHFTGSTSDKLYINDAAPITGANAANVNPTTGRRLFGRGVGGFTNYANCSIAEVLHVSRALTTQERTDLAAYRLARYGF